MLVVNKSSRQDRLLFANRPVIVGRFGIYSLKTAGISFPLKITDFFFTEQQFT